MTDLTPREMEEVMRPRKKLTEADSNRLAKFVAKVEQQVSDVLRRAPEQIKTGHVEPVYWWVVGARKSFASYRIC